MTIANSAEPASGPPAPTDHRWLAAFDLDLRSLALLRMGLGLLLLHDLVQRWTHWSMHYGEAGVMPRGTLMRAAWDPSWFSLATVISRTGEFQIFFLALCAVGVSLTLGWYTRWSTFLAWVGLVSLHNRNPAILDLGDAHLRMALFWMLFLPWGSAWSLDARQGRPDRSLLTEAPSSDGRTVRSLANLAVLLQLVVIVWSLALAAALTSDPSEPRGMPWAQLFQGTSILSHLHPGLVEILGLLFLCFPFDRGQTGGVAFALFALLNGALAALTDSGLLFPLLTILPLALVRAWWYDVRFAKQAQALDRMTLPAAAVPSDFLIASSASHRAWKRPRLLLHGLVVAFVFGWTFLHLVESPLEVHVPNSLSTLGRFLRIEPARERFPLTHGAFDEKLVMSATRRDHTKLTRDESREPSLDVDDPRNRNYLATLWSGQDPWLLFAYGHYLCVRWSPEVRGLSDIDELKVSTQVPADSLERKEQVLLQHRCFGRKK